jgi:hypothetical protein
MSKINTAYKVHRTKQYPLNLISIAHESEVDVNMSVSPNNRHGVNLNAVNDSLFESELGRSS